MVMTLQHCKIISIYVTHLVFSKEYQMDYLIKKDAITAITEQSEKDALKTAFGPIFDLPVDLDGIVGQWTSVKAKFPKPE